MLEGSKGARCCLAKPHVVRAVLGAGAAVPLSNGDRDHPDPYLARRAALAARTAACQQGGDCVGTRSPCGRERHPHLVNVGIGRVQEKHPHLVAVLPGSHVRIARVPILMYLSASLSQLGIRTILISMWLPGSIPRWMPLLATWGLGLIPIWLRQQYTSPLSLASSWGSLELPLSATTGENRSRGQEHPWSHLV